MWTILATNSNLSAWAIGTYKTGKPFASEQAAEKTKAALENRYPSCSFVVLELMNGAAFDLV